MAENTVRGDFNESAFLAAGGDDLAARHGTTTTTDWGLLSTEECHAAVDDEGIEGQFETAHIFR